MSTIIQAAPGIWLRTIAIAGFVAIVSAVPAAGQEAASGPAGTDQMSADQVAKKLENPNDELASLTFKNQYRWYRGSLPNANDQSYYRLLFRPVFPFTLAPPADGGKQAIYFRPAFPFDFDQPVYDSATGRFRSVTSLGDVDFDFAYGRTKADGFVWALGMAGTLPTATDSRVAGKQLRLGPEFIIGKKEPWGLVAIFPSHRWDVAGWGGGSYSTSKIQVFLKYLPGDGWSISSSPTMTYNWKSERWTVPVNFSVSKTVEIGGMKVKIGLETDYYVVRSDKFDQEWMLGLNITPVVENVIARMFQ